MARVSAGDGMMGISYSRAISRIFIATSSTPLASTLGAAPGLPVSYFSATE
ncbi:hypothetical protein D3C86_2150670 [compost metagenome]